MESVLRPRDIQARIRSGESPESVAAAAQTTVDRIMGFAVPVLAERAHVAQQAQKASVRRRAGDGPVGHLGEAVAERLAREDVDPDLVEWDAWRREDGRWTLVADYAAADGQRHAQFVFDVAGRYVVADDDEGRRLVGERATARTPAELTSDQVSLGDDAIALVTGRPVAAVADLTDEPEPEAAADARTEELTEVARPLRSVAAAPPAADWIATQASERPAAPEAAAPEPEPEPEPEPAPTPAATTAPAPAPAEQDALFEVAPEPAEEAAPEAAGDEDTAKPRRPARAKGRASVPSWDEIMFGSAKNE
jgi:Protein of unknown function (DUF3071)